MKKLVLLCAMICLPFPAFAQAPAVTARLTQLFPLKVSNTIRYVPKPVEGFKGTDTNTSVALVAKC